MRIETVSPWWRGDPSGQGRRRSLGQVDATVVGSDSVQL